MERKKYPQHPVLLVDDEKNFLDSLDFSLRSNGITNIFCCSDSRQVMPLLEKRIFSLILLDMIMPHIDGYELLPKIMKSHPDTPVILLTAVDEEEKTIYCMREGALDYLLKPVETTLLLKCIRNALEPSPWKREIFG